jgi:hypothetical protein
MKLNNYYDGSLPLPDWLKDYEDTALEHISKYSYMASNWMKLSTYLDQMTLEDVCAVIILEIRGKQRESIIDRMCRKYNALQKEQQRVDLTTLAEYVTNARKDSGELPARPDEEERREVL